jgi:hypothetical protein
MKPRYEATDSSVPTCYHTTNLDLFTYSWTDDRLTISDYDKLICGDLVSLSEIGNALVC